MIGISTPTLDQSGELILHELGDTAISQYSRRINATATLDGGVSVEDNGFTGIDRPISIAVKSTTAIMASLKYLLENYTTVNLSTREGFNTAVIKKLNDIDGKITLECG